MIKPLKIFLTFLLFLSLFCSAGAAQEAAAQTVSGNTYTCYFITPLDVVSTSMTFNEKGAIALSSFTGNGSYVLLPRAFTASYWSLNAQIGNISGDIIFILRGRSSDSFISGTGIMTIEYSKTYFFIFWGTRQVDE